MTASRLPAPRRTAGDSTWVRTAESVTAGHADKICDQIADDILDAILREDRYARVACEVMATTGMVIVTGQITTKCYLDITGLVRSTIRRVGYDDPSTGFDHRSCSVLVMLEEQSGDVALGVDRKGAGDQGVCVGYATDEGCGLPVDMHYMPAPTLLANRLARRLQDVREDGKVPYLYPDGKVQVSVSYRDGTPASISAVVVSAHHKVDADLAQLRRDLKRLVVTPVLGPTGLLGTDAQVLINPVGAFREGGPRADSGLTGRKIAVDCFGPACPHGGSALSGKDPTKPDRSGTYAARWVAKNLVAAGLARRCAVEVAYVIGMPEPLSITVLTEGTGVLPDPALARIVQAEFDLSPAGIIESLDLRRPVYGRTAVYGHFGRDEDGFTWERLDRVDSLRKHLPGGKRPARTKGGAR
ncbi:MAG: methionine adenosyltransferase [bacterium]|nr:methionine adenosyltransferase [bacterium]